MVLQAMRAGRRRGECRRRWRPACSCGPRCENAATARRAAASGFHAPCSMPSSAEAGRGMRRSVRQSCGELSSCTAPGNSYVTVGSIGAIRVARPARRARIPLSATELASLWASRNSEDELDRCTTGNVPAGCSGRAFHDPVRNLLAALYECVKSTPGLGQAGLISVTVGIQPRA